MINKYLILIGRTFIATFFLVNFFNIIPFEFSRNVWFVQVSMLLVDTASLMLLGLACLKLVPFLSIKDNKLINPNKELTTYESTFDEDQEQKYKKNLININKFSTYLIYFFLFIALFQIFVLVNGVRQIDLMYSERILKVEREFDKFKNKNSAESKLNKEINNQPSLDNKLIEKNKLNTNIVKEANKGKFLLVRNFIRVFLMSLVWAYGFFKLAKFS